MINCLTITPRCGIIVDRGGHIYNMRDILVYQIAWPTCRGKDVLHGDVAKRTEELVRQAAREQGLRLLKIWVEMDQVTVRVQTDDPHTPPHLIAYRLKASSSPILREEFPELLVLPSLWTREYTIKTITPKSKT